MRGLKGDSLLDAPAFLQGSDHLLNVEAFLEGRLVPREQLLDPLLGEQGQRAALAGDDVAVEVEDCDLVPAGLLPVFQDELLDVPAALEQLLSVLHLEHRLCPVVPPLARDHAHRPQGLRVDLHLVGHGLAAELPVCFCSRKRGDSRSVVQEDLGEQLVLVQQSEDVEQVLAAESLAVLGQALPHLLHLRLVGCSVDRDELAADLHLPELGREAGSVNEEALLVESSEQRLQGGPRMCVAALVLVQQVEERPGPQVVSLEAFVQGIAQCPDQLQHVLGIEEVEPEGVPVGGLVEVAAAEAVPQRDVRADLRGHELRQSAHAGHRLRGGQPEDQVFREVGPDRVQVLDLALAHQDPQDSEVHVQIAHDLAAGDQLGDRVVAHSHVRPVRAERNGPEQPVLREGVFPHLVGVLHAGEGGDARLELGLEVGIVQDPERAGVDVIDNPLLHSQQERLALVDQDLRHVLVHDDGTLDGILGEILELDSLVDLSLHRLNSSGHLVGLDLAHAVLSPQISAETDEVVDLLLELASAALLEVALGHVFNHAEGVLQALLLEHRPDLLAVAHLLAQLLGQLLHQPALHGHQLVLELGVAVPAHVDRYDQLLDAGVLGLEVLQTDLFEGVEHLVVLLRVLHHRLQLGGAGAAEDLALGPAGERAGDREVGLAVVADHVAHRLGDFELLLIEGPVEDGVAAVNLVVAHLAVCHQDDIPEALPHDLLGNVAGIGAAGASLALDAGLELLLAGEAALRVPEVIMGDVLGVLVEDLADGLPIVLTVPHGTGVIDKQRIRVLRNLHHSLKYKGKHYKCTLIIIL